MKLNQGAKCIRGRRCEGGFEACPGKFSCGKKKKGLKGRCCCPKTEPTPNPKTEPTTAPTNNEPTTAKPTTELMVSSGKLRPGFISLMIRKLSYQKSK